jgi:phosphopantetheinyl transferase
LRSQPTEARWYVVVGRESVELRAREDRGHLSERRARAVGVDVEPLSAAGQIADIAARYLPPDRVAAIWARRADMQDEPSVGLWTEVEACAKLDGCGLAELDPRTAAALLDRDLRRVRFAPTRGHVATLVYEQPAAHVSYLAFDPVAFESTVDDPPG